jgi:hypothetical protein
MEVDMNQKLRFKIMAFLGTIALAFLALAFTSACKSNPKEETAAPAAEVVDLNTVSAILGKAEGEKSGLFDLGKAGDELQVVYHFYTAELTDINDDIGAEMAPKIRELYRTLKTVDRVVFSVEVAHPTALDQWKPYCKFATTRKLMEETDWTNLLATDFFRVVLELKYAEQ